MNTHSLPIALDFDEGIDRKTLRRLRDRFVAVNRVRWQRARSALTYRQQVVLDILPLMFHLNHPSLPGYLHRDCPYGLSHYEPDDDALGAAQRLARSFAYRDAGKRRPDLEALFLMGSPGSLGHSVASDLDVWLCHDAGLPDSAIKQLEQKAEAVSAWADSLGVELNVFVFSAADWRQRQQRAEVAGENCGSAQHYLLLDEFYRTSIHLGGRYPLWWLVPVEHEADYEARTRQLIECRFIRGDEYIDFGSVPQVPQDEFLGAGVWQLYKGIDSPWKSILKLLLIECYARTQDQGPLALAFKAAVYQGDTDADHLDPYMMLYQRLDSWLTGEGAEKRLELVQRSLYLKAGFPLTRAEQSGAHWRGQLLLSLVRAWGWDEGKLHFLDNRQRWRVEDVISLRRTVVNEFTHSYRLLSRLARGHGGEAAISQRDLNLLGRKLYAVFQRKAGKIELINPNLAPSLAEENLSFLHQSAQEGEGADGWLLFRDLENSSDAFWQPVIRRSSNLAELMLWCYCNGLLTRATRLNLRAGSSAATVGEARELLEALAEALPMPVGPPEREALQQPVRPLRTLLLVNVGIDPQARLTELGLHKLSARSDSLGFSGGRENLVHSIDQITLNSWHEVSLQHYAAGDTLIQCLKNVLAAAALAPDCLPALSVHSRSAGHGQSIARRVQEVFDDVIRQFFAGGRGPHPLRYVLEVDRRYFVLQFAGQEPGFTMVENLEGLMAHLCRPQAQYVPVVFDRHALQDNQPLRAVCQSSEPDSIQVFYQVAGKQVLLWVVDEVGSVFHWRREHSGRRHMLRPLLRFLENLLERRQLRDVFSAPGGMLDIRCYELVDRRGHWLAEQRTVAFDDSPISGMEVQAVGIRNGDGDLYFDIYCNGQDFSVQEYGEQLIPAVAHYIRSLRQSGGSYPVYLTDLHLPHDLEPQGYQQELQTSQYLYYRQQLEVALNRALAN